MFIVITISALVVMLAYEMRHRMAAEQLAYLDNEVHRIDSELKIVKASLARRDEADKKAAHPDPFSQL